MYPSGIKLFLKTQSKCCPNPCLQFCTAALYVWQTGMNGADCCSGWGPHQHWDLQRWRGSLLPGQSDAVRLRAQAVWAAHQPIPGCPIHACRHGHRRACLSPHGQVCCKLICAPLIFQLNCMPHSLRSPHQACHVLIVFLSVGQQRHFCESCSLQEKFQGVEVACGGWPGGQLRALMLALSRPPWNLPWRSALPRTHATALQTMLCRSVHFHEGTAAQVLAFEDTSQCMPALYNLPVCL